MTTAAQGRFSAYSLSNTTSIENPLQTMTPSFGNNGWKPDSIWSNGRNVIGSTYSSQRDPPGSRGSDEASPTTVSGSAQLTYQSEADTPIWNRSNTWGALNGSAQGRSSSGTASPSQTRDALVQQSLPEPRPFQTRPSKVQNGAGFPARTNTNNSFAQAFGGTNDSLDNGLPYSTGNQNSAFETTAPFKRGSQGDFPSFGQNRENSISGQRANEFSSQTTPGSISHDNPQYPFDGTSRGSISRPSAPHQSISYPASVIPNRTLPPPQPVSDQSLSNRLLGSLSISSNRGNDNGFNPTTRAFNPDPLQQPWSGDATTDGRGFNQTYQQQDPYLDQIPISYTDLKRGSIDRASPVSASFSRNGVPSPRYTPGNGSRQESWSQSRPISRGPSIPHEFERHAAAAYSQASGNYYPNGTYYGNNFPAPYVQQMPTYDIYSQNGGYRSPMPMSSYGLMNHQYMPQVSVPVRPSRDQDPGKGIRSLLLEEFRKSHRNNKHYELKDIFGHVVEFSGDQHGSRFIQEKLKSANSDEKDLVFQEIKSNAVQLMKDVFGNYVIQKFFEHGSQVQKTVLTKAMKGKVADLSKQLYACRVVQTALEHVLVDQQEDIIEEIKPHLETIVKDNNGNHVVQKCMSVAPRVILPFIMATFRGSIRSISTNQFGCRVIQRIIDYGTLEEKRELMAEIHACAVPLIMDMFGNYVAQWVFESKDAPQEDKDRFANVVVEHLIEFSTNKCASNVVEKCLEFGTVDYRRAILTKLITADSKGRSPLDKIMLDQFGNYVIQKGIKHLEDQDRTKFLDEMERRFLVLNRNTDSRTIRQLGVIEKILEKYKQEREANAKTGSAQQAELHIDVHTTANTPALTSENSSPKSASSPSTKSGDETVAETGKATVDASLSINGQPEVVDVDGVVG